MADRSKANYPSQNAGKPSPDKTRDFWRNSCLVGPQTAGIPTAHNEDELSSDDAVMASDNLMAIPSDSGDMTGGAVDYHKSQRRR
jgi:hypothetical protein